MKMSEARGAATVPGDPAPELTAFRVENPATALGLAVAYLMTMPAFARLPFGRWSGVLVGAINRGHYVFVRENGEVAGFAGWALATPDAAERWLAGHSDPATEAGREGACMIVNAWAASSDPANRLLLRAMRIESRDRTIYARREYPDGRSRPLRLAARPSAIR
jgi:hemolysin-activating ACP:hemolysin acyltransferase